MLTNPYGRAKCLCISNFQRQFGKCVGQQGTNEQICTTVVKILKWNGGHGTVPSRPSSESKMLAPSIHAGLPTRTLSMPPTVNTVFLPEPMRVFDFMTSTFLWMTTLWHISTCQLYGCLPFYLPHHSIRNRCV